MGGPCSTNGGEEELLQIIGGKATELRLVLAPTESLIKRVQRVPSSAFGSQHHGQCLVLCCTALFWNTNTTTYGKRQGRVTLLLTD
jgi:hypothetical protein